MATDHSGLRTMHGRHTETDDAGSLIIGWSSEMREEAATGAWTVRLLHGAPQDIGGADEERERGAQFCRRTAAQNTT